MLSLFSDAVEGVAATNSEIVRQNGDLVELEAKLMPIYRILHQKKSQRLENAKWR